MRRCTSGQGKECHYALFSLCEVLTAFTRRLRVSSTIMSHGSPVFKSMFSLRFKEGHELAASSFIEVPLPDDAGYVMHILCLILHHRNDGVPDAKDLSPSQILDIAEASDKYDCTAALKFTAWCWLETAKAKLSVGERGDLLTAAYYFRNGDAFAEFGRSLIFDTEGTIWEPQSYCESPLRKLFGEFQPSMLAQKP